MASILIVDDQPHVIRVLSLSLAREGHEIRSARNGAEGLAAIHEKVPDVVVTDINMPVMTGRELCAAIAEQLPERRFAILVMSSLTDQAERDWVRRMQAVEFVEKPVSPRRLTERIRELTGGAGMVTGGAP